MPFLEESRRSSKSEPVFPGADGRDALAGSGPAEGAADRARARRRGRLLGPLLPPLQEARCISHRATRRWRAAQVPEVQHEALADGQGPADAVPRSPAHDRDASLARARRRASCATCPASSRREDHDGHLRTPGRRGPARGHQQAPAIAVCCILAARLRVDACRRARLHSRSLGNQQLELERETGFEPATLSLGS